MTPGDEGLSESFLAGVSEDVLAEVRALPDLDETLAQLLRGARAAWPEISVEPAAFAGYLAACVTAATPPAETLRTVRAAEVYLICACRAGHRGALEALESTYLTRVAAALKRLGTPEPAMDDVKQVLRDRLLLPPVAGARRAPYAGRGELAGWLCITAVREARHVLRKAGRERPITDDDFVDHELSRGYPELSQVRALYRAEFKAAFEEAMASLTSKERNVLRYSVLEGLNLEQIGGIYRVHRATVARWIEASREQLLRRTKQALLDRGRIERADLESVLRMVQSDLDVSIRRLLGDQPPA
jgi:RNA polymerase sigma-70 factor (ECF subfamily)